MNGMRGMLYLPVKGTDDRFAFFPGETEYENGKITRVTVLTESDLTPQERDTYVLPGLIDIHLHGCMGVDFCDCGKLNVLETMCAFEIECPFRLS